MNKIYLVIENHDNMAFTIVGACPNREIAKMLKQKSENSYNIKDCEITLNMWDKMLSTYYSSSKYVNKGFSSQAMFELFPEYSISDIEAAARIYNNTSYIETTIEEINLYTNDSDVMLYGNNS